MQGIRDFEHFSAFDGRSRRLYELIGTHALSLVLVAGSYCRNHDEDRIGLDERGFPVNARDLFDEAWMHSVLEDIFINYYEGFTGRTKPFPRIAGSRGTAHRPHTVSQYLVPHYRLQGLFQGFRRSHGASV